MTLIGLCGTPLTLLRPVPLAVAVDSVLGSKPLPWFLRSVVPAWARASYFRVLILAAILELAVVLLTQLQSLALYVLQTSTGEKLTLRFQAKLLAHAQRLSFAFHDSRGTIDSIYRIQYDAPSIQYIAVFGVLPIICAGVTLVSMIAVIFGIDPLLGCVALVISPLLFLYARYYSLRMRPRYKEAKRLQSVALGVVQEVLTGFRVVKAYGRERHEELRFADRAGAGVRARVRLAFAESTFQLLVNLTTALGTALVLVIGVVKVRSQQLTLGELVLVIGYLALLYDPLQEVSKQIASLQNQLAGAERAFELLDEVPEVDECPDARSLRRARGEIAFRDVSFSYDGTEQVLDHANVLVPAGTRLGIVGPSGAGKTTLVSLVCRFYDPTEGSILLDGVDVRDYRLADLRNQFAIMLQEPVLFSTTVADNIAYARPGATIDEIIAAARTAGAHDFVSRLPDGYNTLVGERGMRLSGGERQRISLARAFLKNAPILVLDEPTSSVDTETEAAIMSTMTDLMVGRTTLMIAHRHGTLAECDLIIELRDGQSHVRAPSTPKVPAVWHAVPTGRRPKHPETSLPMVVLPDTRGIEAVLRDALGSSSDGSRDDLEVVHRRRNPYSSTFPSEIVTYQVHGRHFEVFCKYGPAKPADDDAHLACGHRRGVAYEALVYRKLLEPLGTSAARFHGACDLGDRICLVLEYVRGADRVDKSPDIAAMPDAARWIGRFHARSEQLLAQHSTLRRYDADYYREWIRSTSSLVQPLEPEHPWLRAVYAHADTLVELLDASPRVLIHGEYYPHNILYHDRRVVPVDWESAAVGPGEVDLMTLTENWDEALVRRCQLHYARARWPNGAPPDWERRLLAARAYLQFRFLSDTKKFGRDHRWRLRLLHDASRELGLLT